jgi:adenylate cyclase
VEIGVGISTGDEFCGNVGGGGFKDFTAVGEVTNTAARLTARAVAGETLVDAATRAAVMEFAFIDGGLVTLKGMSAPVQTYRLALDAALDSGVEERGVG